MAQLLNGNISLSKLNEAAKQGHSAFYRGAKDGKIYVNLSVWLNDQEDQFGNIAAFQLQSKKECREAEGKIYIGNAKPSKVELEINKSEIVEDDDYPF